MNLLPSFEPSFNIPDKNFLDYFPSHLQDALKQKKTSYYVILSSNGCSYCKTHVEEFFKNYDLDLSLPYVILEHDYEIEDLIIHHEKSNLKIKVNNGFMNSFFIKVFPSFLVVDSNHQIIDVARASPLKIIKNHLKGGER